MKKNDGRRVIALLLCLLLCLQMCLPPTAVLAEDGADSITNVSAQVIHNGKSTYYYDGNPVSITASCEGITEWTISYSDSVGSVLGYAPSAIGNYTVQMNGKGTDCYASVTHSFSIVEGQIAYSVGNYSGAYDGQPHSISLTVDTPDVSVYYRGPDDSEYAEVNPTFTESGTYTVSYILEKVNYESVTGSATVTITPAAIAYTIGGFDGTDEYSVAYDGKPHSISLSVTTPDVDVRYATNSEGPFSAEIPSFTDAGQYVVYFTLEKQNYESVVDSVTVEITSADVSDQVVFNNESFYTYTGSPVDFAPSCAGIKSWSYVYYDANNIPLNDAPTAVGSYRVEITGEGANCYAQITHSYSIVAAEIQYTANGYSGVYDGEAHSITVDVTTEGACVTYTASMGDAYTEDNPTFTDAGEYPVWFMIEKDNYVNVSSCMIVTIEKADVSDQLSFDGQASYAYTGSAVKFSPSCAGIDTWTYTYYENDTQLDAAPSAPGSYRVEICGEGANHIAQLSHSYSIVQMETTLKEIAYTARDYTGTYDGRQHSIALDVTTPDITVTYATSANGTYTETKPTFTSAGRYTVYYRLEGEGYETAESSATVTISRANISELVTFNLQDEYPFTGSPVSFSPSCSDISTWTFTYYDESGKQLTQAPSDVGSYSVSIYGSGTNYYASVSHAYRIAAQEIEYTASGYTGYHDGAAHTIDLSVTTEGVTATYATSEGGPYSATKPSFTDPGEYTVWFRLEKAGYETVTSSASVTIAELQKIRHDANDYEGYYDGKAHSITLSVATEGVTVTYAESRDGTYSAENPTFTEPGSYTVWFKLEKEGYETDVNSASVTILELRQIEYSVEDNFVYYDGNEHTFALNVVTEGVDVTYSREKDGGEFKELPYFTKKGEYTIWFKLVKAGYKTVRGSATLTIAEPGTIFYELTNYEGTYDGQPHSISLNVITEGVDVTYTDVFNNRVTSKTPPVFTEPGTYLVDVKLEKEGYTTHTDAACVTIDAGKIEYSVRGYSGYADGKPHSISLNVSTPDVTVTYSTSADGEYSATKPSFTEAGTYNVYYWIKKEHYGPVFGYKVVQLWQPNEYSIVYSCDDYFGAYDGEAHTIAMDVTTPGVKATYATSKGGEYGEALPTFTEPGSYTVWYRLEKSGYETETGSATVTIEKAEQVLYFRETVMPVAISENATAAFLYWSGLLHDKGDGALSWSSSDPDRISLTVGSILAGTLRFSVPYEEWSKGYSATITATAAETDHYKAATATCKYVFCGSVQGSYDQSGGGYLLSPVKGVLTPDTKLQGQETLLKSNVDLTVRPVTDQDSKLLSGVSNELRRKLMAAAGSDKIGAMAVDAVLTDKDTGEELHSTTGDLTISFTGELLESYQQNYKNMACVAVHIKQNSTTSSTAASQDMNGTNTDTGTSSPTASDAPLEVPDYPEVPVNAVGIGIENMGNSGLLANLYLRNTDNIGVTRKLDSYGWVFSDSTDSNGEQLLTSAVGDMTVVPVSSLSSKVELIRCELTENGVVIKDTSLSPFLLIYGPKEAFSDLLTVRAQDGVFIYDGEGHQVAAEPSIAEGTTLYYSLDQENWQTEVPTFTDVVTCEDGTLGAYLIYALAVNPDCGAALCSYTVTILPEQ